MIYCFDVDGTLCDSSVRRGQEKNTYENASPYPMRIKKVNKLYDAGNTIKLFTARGSTTGIDHRELTEKQLKEWGVKYHELILGKPHYDIMIDDKAKSDIDFFYDVDDWESDDAE